MVADCILEAFICLNFHCKIFMSEDILLCYETAKMQDSWGQRKGLARDEVTTQGLKFEKVGPIWTASGNRLQTSLGLFP